MRHPLWTTSAGWGWGWELSPCLLGGRWARASRCAPRPHRVPNWHLGTPERAQRGPQPRVSLGSPWWHSPALPTWQGQARRPLLDEASPGPTPKKKKNLWDFSLPLFMERGGSARCNPIARPGGASFKAPPPPIRCPDFQHLAVEKWQGRVWQRSSRADYSTIVSHFAPSPASSSSNNDEERRGASARGRGVEIRDSTKISSLWNKYLPTLLPFVLVVLIFFFQTFTGKMSH